MALTIGEAQREARDVFRGRSVLGVTFGASCGRR
jgi:hypothetical protein